MMSTSGVPKEAKKLAHVGSSINNLRRLAAGFGLYASRAMPAMTPMSSIVTC
jgi:hypothetical protein